MQDIQAHGNPIPVARTRLQRVSRNDLFVATSEAETYGWSNGNIGRLAKEFEQVVSLEPAMHLLDKPEGGEAVEFPNRYELREVQGEFGGRWGD